MINAPMLRCGDPAAAARPATIAEPPDTVALIQVRDLNVWYGEKQALFDVSYDLVRGEILAFIGPSGCGKTTALKCLNLMLDEVRDIRIEGSIRMNDKDIRDPDIDPPELRRRFGWVAQKANPFPATIYDNVAYGAGIHGLKPDKADMDAHVERCLREAELWDEVKDVLTVQYGPELSGGQQQRLCIARALGTNPDVLLMDEPTGSIDPIAARKIENLLLELRGKMSIIIITHSMMEARRVAGRVAMFHLGRIVEVGATAQMFDEPEEPDTQNFVTGRVG